MKTMLTGLSSGPHTQTPSLSFLHNQVPLENPNWLRKIDGAAKPQDDG